MTGGYTAGDLAEAIAANGGGAARVVEVLGTVDSTSSELFRRLEAGAPAGTVVAALAQTSGRGRLGRTWLSGGPGNVCLSVAVEVPGEPGESLPMVPLAAGAAAAAAVREACGARPVLKWPNDLMLNGRKLGGILCEARDLEQRPLVAVAGLGLNIGPMGFPAQLEDVATDLASFVDPGGLPSAADLSARWICGLEARVRLLAGGGRGEALEEWRSLAEPFGRRVRVGEIEGATEGLDGDGRLLVRTDSGRLEAVPGGVVESAGG